MLLPIVSSVIMISLPVRSSSISINHKVLNGLRQMVYAVVPGKPEIGYFLYSVVEREVM